MGASMIGRLHNLQRSEEGQALVLAAIFGLVLMICVLGTVNLGRTVYEKIQLQAAADSAAYSQAAVEARVLNFTAYTNRAMVVHYASLMAATSYLAYVHFEWPLLKALFEVFGKLPYVGPAFAAMEQAVQAVIGFLDAAVFALAPLLSAANIALYGLQEGAWWSVYGRLASLPPEAHSGDSAARPYQPIWPELIPLANQAVFAQTRGHLTMPQNTDETVRILLDEPSDAVREARLYMLEIANSARQPWVAYGDGHPDPSPSPAARHFRWPLVPGHLWYGNRARTELGASRGGAAQIWSGQQNALGYDFDAFGLHFSGSIPFFTFVAVDQLAATAPPFKSSWFGGFRAGTVLKEALFTFFPGIDAWNAALTTWAAQSAPQGAVDKRLFVLSPYVHFAARASNVPGRGLSGALGNFGQPDVLVGLAKEGRDMNAEPGAGGRFSWNGRSAGSAAADLAYTDRDWPRLAGMPRNLQLLHRGLNAFAAAQVYYHRPGEWKEQPNFFNPLWGARLIPVLESNAAAKLGFTSVPLLRQWLLH